MGDVDNPLRYTEADVQRIAAEAVRNAIQQFQRPTSCQVRKPDLPAFDRKNIDVWIQRVEAAYARNGVDTPKDKFAFLETKFPVEFNPKVNAFLYSTPSDQSWINFLDYLRQEYGRTTRQKASTLIDGVARESLRPSQYYAKLVDLTKDVTIEDVRKEHLLRQLPSNVRHALSQQLEDTDAEALAPLADAYFDRDGRPFSSASSSSTNSVVNASNSLSEPFTSLYIDEETEDNVDTLEVNEVSRPGRSNFQKHPRSRSRSRPPRQQSKSDSSRVSFSGSSSSGRQKTSNSASQPADECWYHWKFGTEAKQCQPGCKRQKPQGNGRVGQRK